MTRPIAEPDAITVALHTEFYDDKGYLI